MSEGQGRVTGVRERAAPAGGWRGLARRAVALAVDAPIVLGWIAVTTIIGAGLRAAGIAPTTPTGWDLYAFLTLVLPVVLTLAWFEARRGATPGKRRAGWTVVTSAGAPLGWGRALARSAVKLTPWQLAHTAVFHLAGGSESAGLLALSIGAQLVVVASAVLVGVDPAGRALHDRLAGTRLTPRSGLTTPSGLTDPDSRVL